MADKCHCCLQPLAVVYSLRQLGTMKRTNNEAENASVERKKTILVVSEIHQNKHKKLEEAASSPQFPFPCFMECTTEKKGNLFVLEDPLLKYFFAIACLLRSMRSVAEGGEWEADCNEDRIYNYRILGLSSFIRETTDRIFEECEISVDVNSRNQSCFRVPDNDYAKASGPLEDILCSSILPEVTRVHGGISYVALSPEFYKENLFDLSEVAKVREWSWLRTIGPVANEHNLVIVVVGCAHSTLKAQLINEFPDHEIEVIEQKTEDENPYARVKEFLSKRGLRDLDIE